MKIVFTVLFTMAFGLLMSCKVSANDSFEFSGFARAVGGYYNQDNTVFGGYEDEVSLSEQSLIAIRGDYEATSKLSFVAQAIAHSSEIRESGIQWLYANYQFTHNLSVRVGRQRIPFFQYSDVIDVGFAYPWITPPVPTYNEFLFTEFDGVTGRYHFSNQTLYGYIESYYGGFDGDIKVFERTLKADTDNVLGLNLNLNISKLMIRLSANKGHATLVQPELTGFVSILNQLGFNRTADAFTVDGETRMYQAGFSFDELAYFIRGELTQFDSDSFMVGSRKGGYLTVGINRYPFTYHATIATGKTQYDPLPNEIPLGVNVQIDQLFFGSQAIYDNLPVDSGKIYTFGVRYDLNDNLAMKGEVSLLRGDSGDTGFLSIPDPSIERQSGELFQLAIEWVF